MSISKWRYTEECNGRPCPGDCDHCSFEPGDLISRADAIDCCECHGSQECKDRIKALPSADAEWIPCNERLPEDGTTVITFDSMGDIEFGSYENGKWYWLAEACADYWTRNSGVLAWMPLPEPYRGEQIDSNT